MMTKTTPVPPMSKGANGEYKYDRKSIDAKVVATSKNVVITNGMLYQLEEAIKLNGGWFGREYHTLLEQDWPPWEGKGKVRAVLRHCWEVLRWRPDRNHHRVYIMHPNNPYTLRYPEEKAKTIDELNLGPPALQLVAKEEMVTVIETVTETTPDDETVTSNNCCSSLGTRSHRTPRTPPKGKPKEPVDDIEDEDMLQGLALVDDSE